VVAGALVAGASATEKSDFVRSLGAVHTLDTRDDGWRDSLKKRFSDGIDRVFDPVGSNAFEPAFRSLAKRGRYLIVGFAAGNGIPKLPVHLPLLKSAELAGVDARYLVETDRRRANTIMRRVFAMAEMGLIQPHLAGEFMLEESIEAFRLLGDRSRIGKCVVRPNSE
jgi:NADPH:quinone reductase-like Zn-dependent oxidoreductase